jgi:DNA modification methylase
VGKAPATTKAGDIVFEPFSGSGSTIICWTKEQSGWLAQSKPKQRCCAALEKVDRKSDHLTGTGENCEAFAERRQETAPCGQRHKKPQGTKEISQ